MAGAALAETGSGPLDHWLTREWIDCYSLMKVALVAAKRDFDKTRWQLLYKCASSAG